MPQEPCLWPDGHSVDRLRGSRRTGWARRRAGRSFRPHRAGARCRACRRTGSRRGAPGCRARPAAACPVAIISSTWCCAARKRLLAAPLGDVARNREQLDDGAIHVGDRRHHGVKRLRSRRHPHRILKTAASAASRGCDGFLRRPPLVSVRKSLSGSIQQAAGIRHSSSRSPTGFM